MTEQGPKHGLQFPQKILNRVFHWFVDDTGGAAKFLRFALVGATSGIVFAIATSAMIAGLGIDEKVASILGYIVSMPMNFWGNRSFSFRSKGRIHLDATRYVCVHFANMVLVAGLMALVVDGLVLPYWIGVASAFILVPIFTFILMNFWIFPVK